MVNDRYTIYDKQYSKEQLIVLGKERYPKLYWIPRTIGIIFLFVGILMCGLLGITLLTLNLAGVFDDPQFPFWIFYIPFGVFGVWFLIGLICFIASFIGRTEKAYINHAIKYLNQVGPNVDYVLCERDQRELDRSERLFKAGVITQEELEKRKNDIFNKEIYK